MSSTEWQSVIVALGILSLIGAIAIMAMRKYKFEEAMKVLGLLSGLIGVVCGAMTTYFFTRPQIVQTQKQLAALIGNVDEFGKTIALNADNVDGLKRTIGRTESNVAKLEHRLAKADSEYERLGRTFAIAFRDPDQFQDYALATGIVSRCLNVMFDTDRRALYGGHATTRPSDLMTTWLFPTTRSVDDGPK